MVYRCVIVWTICFVEEDVTVDTLLNALQMTTKLSAAVSRLSVVNKGLHSGESDSFNKVQELERERSRTVQSDASKTRQTVESNVNSQYGSTLALKSNDEQDTSSESETETDSPPRSDNDPYKSLSRSSTTMTKGTICRYHSCLPVWI